MLRPSENIIVNRHLVQMRISILWDVIPHLLSIRPFSWSNRSPLQSGHVSTPPAGLVYCMSFFPMTFASSKIVVSRGNSCLPSFNFQVTHLNLVYTQTGLVPNILKEELILPQVNYVPLQHPILNLINFQKKKINSPVSLRESSCGPSEKARFKSFCVDFFRKVIFLGNFWLKILPIFFSLDC